MTRENYYNKREFKNKRRPGAFLFSALITAYQWTLSPDHGIISLYKTGQCKFRPTCSEYTRLQILRLGVINGLREGAKQIRKCY